MFNFCLSVGKMLQILHPINMQQNIWQLFWKFYMKYFRQCKLEKNLSLKYTVKNVCENFAAK